MKMFLAAFLLFITLNAPKDPGDLIYLRNASFEDVPRPSASPVFWFSNTPGSTPDILPGAWKIESPKAYDGQTYIGLITRGDGTVEDIAQQLPQTMKGNTCYKFSLMLAHRKSYAGHNQPVRLRVWGGKGTGKEVLLASSPLIDHEEWKLYQFRFTTPHDIRTLTFEAYFGPGALVRYKGNILLDACSPVEECVRA